MEYNRLTDRLCGHCQSVKSKQSFHSNPIKPREYMPVCKECVNAKYRDTLKKTGSQGAALWAACMIADIPVIKRLYDDAVKQIEGVTTAGRKPSLFSVYIALLNEDDVKYEGIADSDMTLADFVAINKADNSTKVRDMGKRDIWDRTWGVDYDDDDCEWLDDMMAAYTGEIYEMDTGMEMRYRDLCKAELKKFKDGADKEVSDEIFKLMKLLKIDQFKENKQSDTEKFIERMAWTIENTKPAECADLDKYRDFSGMEPTWNHIMRCVKNLVAGSRDYPDVPKDER